MDLIVKINGKLYSKVLLDEVIECATIVEIHGMQFGGYDAQLHHESYENCDIRCLNNSDGCFYQSSLESVAELSGLSLYEVALHYLNGEYYRETKGRYSDGEEANYSEWMKNGYKYNYK